MRADAFQYELPSELIAQHPAKERALARLMVLPPRGGAPAHRTVADFPDLLPPGALVVVNDTRVIPARLRGRKVATGGRAEVFLIRHVADREIEVGGNGIRCAQVWRALGKAGKHVRFGTDIGVLRRGADEESGAALMVRLLGRADEDGLWEVALWTPSGEPIDQALRECGRVPLPPYIKRDDTREDLERYQTVYARHDGAVAAPTAGFHITNATLEGLEARGCSIASITLHVGYGTFQPVVADDLDQHTMHAERYVVTQSAAAAVAQARARKAPIVAVGTTTARALESAADPERPGGVRAMTGETRLLIQPGYTWRVVDGLLTNLHLPKSTLLALVCSFAGHQRLLDAYAEAVRQKYRFFSYGDGMLLWRDR